MSDFMLYSESGQLRSEINEELEERDILEMLRFDEEDIETLLKTHAANQAYWEAYAVRLKNKWEFFKEEWYKKWWAHNKRYARLILSAYGDNKPSIDSLKDTVINIYSVDTTEIEREKFYSLALKEASKKKYFDGEDDDFRRSMFKYINLEPAWYFETVMQTLRKLQEDYETVEIVAEKLNARSFHMQNILQLLMAKRSNLGPQSFSEKDMMGKISKGV